MMYREKFDLEIVSNGRHPKKEKQKTFHHGDCLTYVERYGPIGYFLALTRAQRLYSKKYFAIETKLSAAKIQLKHRVPAGVPDFP